MYTNNCLQCRNEMPAVKERKTHKRNQISVQGLIELRQTKIKNHTADVDLSLLKHLNFFMEKILKSLILTKTFANFLFNILQTKLVSNQTVPKLICKSFMPFCKKQWK